MCVNLSALRPDESLCLRLLSMKLSGAMSSEAEYEPCDHELSRIAKDPNSMDAIDVQYVEENWKTEAFVSFCFFNARVISMTPQKASTS